MNKISCSYDSLVFCIIFAERPWNESLSARIAEVQQAFKNIPQMLYFSPSSVALDGIGVYAAESLPKGTTAGRKIVL